MSTVEERSYVEAVGAVVTAADARDHETSGHSFRVALYAVSPARLISFASNSVPLLESLAIRFQYSSGVNASIETMRCSQWAKACSAPQSTCSISSTVRAPA